MVNVYQKTNLKKKTLLQLLTNHLILFIINRNATQANTSENNKILIMLNGFSIYCNVMKDKTTGQTYNDFPSLKSMILNSAYADPYRF